MIFYDSPQATVTWNKEDKVVVLQWKSFAQGEQYRTPLNKLLELGLYKSGIRDHSKQDLSTQHCLFLIKR